MPPTPTVAESREQAMQLYKEPAEYFYGRCLHVDPRFASPPGYTTEATRRAGMQSQVARAGAPIGTNAGERFQTVQREMQGIVDAGYIIIGSPDEVAAQLREVATSLNVGHLMLLMQYGNMSKQLTQYNTKLFAERVMPQLRDLFADWEDHWWPKPLEQKERAPLPAFTPRIAAE
ncbi:MAG: hypothetical protein QJR07_10560 [Acetobacteraceae bacterium]|nr:hypothetical protein [Acetobacteraceae bacterium]